MAAPTDDKDFEKYKDYSKIIDQLNYIKSIKETINRLDGDAKIRAQSALASEKSKLGYLKKQADETKGIQKGLEDVNKSLTRLPKAVQKEIGTLRTGGGVFLDLAREALELQNRTLKTGDEIGQLTDEQRAANQENASFINTITEEMLTQAKATAEANESLFGASKISKKIEEIESRRAELGDDITDKLLEAIERTELLAHKEERLTEIKEGQKELYEAAPESLRSAIDFTKKLGKAMASGPAVAILLVAAALAAGLESFLELDKAAEDYRKTSGMTVKQTEHLAHQAHEIEVSLRGAGVELKHIFDVSNDLANVFGDMTHFSTQTLAALGGIQARTGATSETAAKVQGIFEQVAGVSGETAASLQMQVASLAQQGKVSPKEVLEDIAENAEATSKFFKGDVNALKAQVIQAHQLGTTLTKVAKVAEDLLDFEGGIEDELVAATYVGGQFNLSRARALAYENDLIGAQKETLKQLNQGVGFKNQDLFTQKALAKAANMSIEDINKQLTMEEKLSHLHGKDLEDAEAAVKSGLDLTDIKDDQLKQKTAEFIQNQKINGQITDMENKFKAITAQVGGALVPIFEALAPILQAALYPVTLMAEGFNKIVGFVKEYSVISGIILGSMAAMYLIQKGIVLYQRSEAVLRLLNMKRAKTMVILNAMSNPARAVAGILAASLVVGAISSMVGDVKSPAKGKTQVSTKEGGIFTLSPNDDLVAAPGAASKMDMVSKMGKGGMAVSSNSDSKYIALLGRVDTLMQKLTTGGIVAHAYMDTSKVTANVANNSNNNTRNNFAFGQG
jgi:chromatin remodeling complex protein RSC6